MNNIPPSMCLKVNRDTFFIPDANRGVYFRNNVSSFRMEGSTIAQWIETLLPMFNGKHSLGDLTAGLQGPHQNQVFNIAKVLLQNGFVRDVSQDQPHQLSEQILQNYASQIEFLDHFGGSGAYRFQGYRQSKVLVIGSGPILQSFVSSLFESGIAKFHIFITDSVSTDRERIEELTAQARKSDSEVAVEEVPFDNDWQTMISPFESVLYVAPNDEIDELRKLHNICRQEKKIFVPAIFLNHTGFAGPVVKPNAEGCWESAWRRIHETELNKAVSLQTDLNTAGALMANLIVFELFKELTGVNEQKQHPQFYLLNSKTLEGSWHTFVPHPLVTVSARATWIENFDFRDKGKADQKEADKWFKFFSQLTSAQSGVFHKWEEGDLKQLPLAQCSVQTVNPLSEGPAELLSEIIVSDLTHMEARRRSGLTGVEAYTQQVMNELLKSLPTDKQVEKHEYIGVGAGEEVEEAVCRGLQKCLDNEFEVSSLNQKNVICTVKLTAVEDERCRYYIQSLTTLRGKPIIGLGEEIFGFPVVWVGTSEGWYASAGLNKTLALRNALQQAIMQAQNQSALNSLLPPIVEKNAILQKLGIPAYDLTAHREILQSAISTLKQNGKELYILNLELEPFKQGELIEVYGVLLREEGLR